MTFLNSVCITNAKLPYDSDIFNKVPAFLVKYSDSTQTVLRQVFRWKHWSPRGIFWSFCCHFLYVPTATHIGYDIHISQSPFELPRHRGLAACSPPFWILNRMHVYPIVIFSLFLSFSFLPFRLAPLHHSHALPSLEFFDWKGLEQIKSWNTE